MAGDGTPVASARDGGGGSTRWMWMVFAMAAAIAGANAATLSLYPLPWLDEIMYVDPTINLLHGNGFTSGTWYNDLFGRFWYSNTPLYEGVLYVWASVTGDGLATLRGLNVVLISAAGVLLVAFAVRSGELRGPSALAAWLACPLLGYGVTYSYRSLRPDALCILLCAALLAAATVRAPSVRRGLLVAVAALVPWAGLQLVAYVVVGALLVTVATGRRHVGTTCALGAGLAVGTAALLVFYGAAGHLGEFLGSTVASQHSLVGQLGQYVVLRDARATQHFDPLRILASAVVDRTSAIGLIASAALVPIALRRRSRAALRRAVAGVGAGLVIPVTIYLLGKYPIYYTWMGMLPVWFFALAAVEHLPATARGARAVAFGLLAVALVVGWPLLVGTSFAAAERRAYEPVRALAARHVAAGEWVCVTPQAYFAVEELRAVPFLCSEYASSRLAPGIPSAQAERFTTIVGDRDRIDEISRRLPGRWTEVDRLLVDQQRTGWLTMLQNDADRYDLVVYRRTG